MTSASPVSAPADTESRVVIRETRRSSAIGKVMVGLLGLVMTAGFVSYQPSLRIDPDTAPALASGCEGAAIALVERSLAQAASLLGAAPTLRLHGGGAATLRPLLPAHDWVPDAVLRGLARWHALAFA